MKIVIKIGGEALEDRNRRRDLAEQVAELHRKRHQVVLVHGGGKMLTRMLTRLNIPTRFLNGLRVTDEATRDVALMILAGAVNKQLVAALGRVQVPALGLCGGDATLVRASRITRKRARVPAEKEEDLGLVGQPQKVNTRILEIAFREGFVPVIASLALDTHCEYLNVNADDLAAALAVSLKADRLLYLTESGGVWDSEQRVLPLIGAGEIEKLIREGIVRNGMIPKLRSCARTLRHLRGEIDILPIDAPGVLVSALRSGQMAGTRIVPQKTRGEHEIGKAKSPSRLE